MNLRKKYINISLQNDNPRDSDSFGLPMPPVKECSLRKLSSSVDLCTPSMTPDLPQLSTPESLPNSMKIGDIVVQVPGDSDYAFKLCPDGVYRVAPTEEELIAENFLFANIPTIEDFYQDFETVTNIVHDGPSKTFAFKRLKFLEAQFEMYSLMSEKREQLEQKKVPHRDFYNIYKNDAHVHHSACMNLKHLLRFIKRKIKQHGDDVVLYRDGKYSTLEDVFKDLQIQAHELSIDALDMHAHQDSFHRFDTFNQKYNPLGESKLREIFLKTDNLIKGRYLAEITKEVFSELETSKYQLAEYRISIYGRSLDEWTKLANWVCDFNLFSPNVRWIIQLPRLYSIYRSSGSMENFELFIRNVFQPLFEVTKDPSSNPKLHLFLLHVVGFDSVDDESKPEMRSFKKFPVAREWNFTANPPYSYYLYYMYANISHLNNFRSARSLNAFALRPHSGEAGDPEHLSVTFLTSLNICHGVLLRKAPVMQYLYYLMQIGIAISPLSNNALFLTYDRNPFPSYFKRGLNVSLSTDDPLLFHFTREPLIEEYSIATQFFKLSPADLGELCRNSVQQSGFELKLKRKWLGEKCHLAGVEGNDIKKTNIPQLRAAYRQKMLQHERNFVLGAKSLDSVPFLLIESYEESSSIDSADSLFATSEDFSSTETSKDEFD